MKMSQCGRFVMWGMIVGLIAWFVLAAGLIYATLYVSDLPARPDGLFTRRSGFQATGFIAGWWLAIVGLTLCVVGYIREFRALKCLFAVVPAAAYVANPWSVLVFMQFIG